MTSVETQPFDATIAADLAAVVAQAMDAPAPEAVPTQVEGNTLAEEATAAPAPQATQAEEQTAAPAADPADKVTCCKCRMEKAPEDCIHRPKNRENLRYACKNCNAVAVQLGRHGIDLKAALTETGLVQFFQQAHAEREAAAEGRITYGQARAILSRQMIEESSHVEKVGAAAEWQPLSFWELKGYDCDKIRDLAESKSHPILGEVFRVSVEMDSHESVRTATERRLCQMEADALQRRQAAEAAAAALVEDDMGIAYAAEPAQRRAGKLTPEEKAAKQAEAKRVRLAQKTAEKARHAACTTAAKLLPGMKSVLERFEKAREPVDSPAWACMNEEDRKSVADILKDLQGTIELGNKTLEAMSKNSGAGSKLPAFPSEKEARRLMKDSNEAIRVLQRFKKEHKDLLCPAAEPKAKRPRKA